MNTLPVGTKVRILTINGGLDWSETGRIIRHHASWRGKEVPAGYHSVRYDSDGGMLMIHRDRLMPANS